MKFIGFYDYTVILTYISLASSVLGMARAIQGDYQFAIFCLAFSGICDAFDGRIARTKKNRTDDEKGFGIQIDSLCDVVCFGVFPAMLCCHLGVQGALGTAITIFYCLCAVIRLAFFNVLESKRQQAEEGANKTYRGLPVTSIAFVLPLVYWLQFIISASAFIVLIHATLLIVGFLFIFDFPMPKPNLKTILAMAGILIVVVGAIFSYTRFHAPKDHQEIDPILAESVSDT